MRASLIAFSIPIFFLLIGIELLVARATHRRLYRFQDSINSLSCGIAQQAVGVGFKAITIGGYALAYERFAVLDLDASAAWVWIAGVLGVDLAYYASHRASHRVGVLWAAHVVHHQSEEYNLTTALRQSALQGAASAPFYWPLAILGLPTELFVLLSTTNTLYQFWIHTRLVGKLGPLEWFLNTPSHHRVHHAIDPKYIDKNYGGIFIVWDRLFGTFEEEREEPAYGTVKPLRSWNPIWANLDHWARMATLAGRAARLRDKVWAFFAPPEWRPAELGGPVVVPEVDPARVLYERPGTRGLHAYVAVQLAVATLSILRILTAGTSASPLEMTALVVWTLASVLAWGGLFEGKRWALPLELARVFAIPLLATWSASAMLPSAGLLGAAVALASAVWVVVVVRRASVARAAVEPAG